MQNTEEVKRVCDILNDALLDVNIDLFEVEIVNARVRGLSTDLLMVMSMIAYEYVDDDKDRERFYRRVLSIFEQYDQDRHLYEPSIQLLTNHREPCDLFTILTKLLKPVETEK